MAWLAGTLLLLLLTLLGSPNTGQVTAPPLTETRQAASTTPRNLWLVARVIDGDTVVVEKNGTQETVRLIGLDTPESVDPRKPIQCFGLEASSRAKSILHGQRVDLEFDASQGTKDKYGRTLAYLRLEDGTLFNKYMISAGFGFEYTYRTPYAYQTEFKEAERTAREAGRGLWAPGACAN